VKIRTEMKQRREEQGEAAQAVPITVGVCSIATDVFFACFTTFQ
jgi:hypothetical protein